MDLETHLNLMKVRAELFVGSQCFKDTQFSERISNKIAKPLITDHHRVIEVLE